MSDAVLTGWRLSGTTRGRAPAVACGLLLAMLTLGFAAARLAHLDGGASATPALVPVPPVRQHPVWIDIQRPVRIFSLEARALGTLPLVYAARRLDTGEGREDVMTFGTTAEPGPTLRLRLYRRDGRVPAPAPLFSALAREAADIDFAITRSSLPDVMTTRFGAFEIAEVTLTSSVPARSAAVGAERACSGFRLVLGAPALTISGLACGTTAHPLTRAALGCLVDRLDLASAGEDRVLIEFFARTELERSSACSGMRLGPDEAHAAWLDDKPATSRKSLRRH